MSDTEYTPTTDEWDVPSLLAEVERLKVQSAAHDREVAAKALRKAAESLPVDLWSTYGNVDRVAVGGMQSWLTRRAARIARGEAT